MASVGGGDSLIEGHSNLSTDSRGLFSGFYTKPGRLIGPYCGHHIVIEAPAALVWDIVVDFAGWGAWNPLYGDTSGLAEEGQTLQCKVKLEGLKPQKAKAQVYRVVPNQLFEYGMNNLGGLAKVFRYIELEALSATRCRVTNGEIMSGLVGRYVLSPMISPKVSSGLKNMNEALLFMAERKWRARPV